MLLCGLISSFSSPSTPIPLMIAHHASVYLVQLPGTDCGQVGPLPARPSASLNPFSSQTLFLFLSMAEPGSRSCQVHWTSVGKRVGRVSRRAVHAYYFRLLAVLPERLWGKKKSLKQHTPSCLFRVKQACQCFILKRFQQDFLLIRVWPYVGALIQLWECSVCSCECTLMYSTLDLRWHMLSSSATSSKSRVSKTLLMASRYFCYGLN